MVRSIINPIKKISDLLNGSSGILQNISESLVTTSNELNDVTAQQSSAVQESVASIAEISATISLTSKNG